VAWSNDNKTVADMQGFRFSGRYIWRSPSCGMTSRVLW